MEKERVSYEEAKEITNDIVNHIAELCLDKIHKMDLDSSKIINKFIKFYPLGNRNSFSSFEYMTDISIYYPIDNFGMKYNAVARDFIDDIMNILNYEDTQISVEDLLIYIIKHLSYQLLGQTRYDYNRYGKSEEYPLPILEPFLNRIPQSINGYCPYRSIFSVIDINDDVYEKLSSMSSLDGYIDVYSNIIVDYLLHVTLNIYLTESELNNMSKRIGLI